MPRRAAPYGATRAKQAGGLRRPASEGAADGSYGIRLISAVNAFAVMAGPDPAIAPGWPGQARPWWKPGMPAAEPIKRIRHHCRLPLVQVLTCGGPRRGPGGRRGKCCEAEGPAGRAAKRTDARPAFEGAAGMRQRFRRLA